MFHCTAGLPSVSLLHCCPFCPLLMPQVTLEAAIVEMKQLLADSPGAMSPPRRRRRRGAGGGGEMLEAAEAHSVDWA